MKKLLLFLLVLSLLLLPTGAAADYPQYYTEIYNTAIQSIDYDGSTFWGISNGCLFSSSDFQHWTPRYLPERPDSVVFVCFLNGDLTVLTYYGTVLISKDGSSFEEYQSELPSKAGGYHLVGDRLYVLTQDENTIKQVCTSADGIHWTPVSPLPWGTDLNYVFYSGKYFIDNGSETVFSEDGVHFSPLPDHPGNQLSYFQGAFHTVGTESGAPYLYSSTDLIHWSKASLSADYSYPGGGSSVHYVEANGKSFAYNLRAPGHRYQLTDGRWQLDSTDAVRALSVRTCGVFWETDDTIRFLADREHTTEEFRYRDYSFGQMRFWDGMFYLRSQSSTPAYRQSADGIHWTFTEDIPAGLFDDVPRECDNGLYRLKANLSTYPLTGVMTCQLTDPSGDTFIVAYEDEYGPYIPLQSDTGYFLLGDTTDVTAYLTADGVTRFPCPVGTIGNGLFLTQVYYPNRVQVESGENLSSLLRPAIRVRLNDIFLSFTSPPVVEEGSTLIPLRFLFEQAGATVEWESETATATIAYQGKNLSFSIGSDVAYLDGSPISLATPARLVDGRTLIPLRSVAEQLGFTVTYDAANHIADVSTSAVM